MNTRNAKAKSTPASLRAGTGLAGTAGHDAGILAALKAQGYGAGRGVKDTWARPVAGNAGGGQGRAQAPKVSPTAGGAGKPAVGSKQAMQALGRLKTGELNKTEQAYHDHLAQRQHAGEVAWFKFEGIKFRLADNTFYTPDFAVMLADGRMQIHETKGFWTDDARVKIKVAAELYPFEFIAIKKKAKKDGGGWQMELF